MELVNFYRALLPAHGSYCLWFKGTKRHVWFDSLDDLVSATEDYSSQPDWYFGTASFAVHERKQNCVEAKRCLYLDLDAGPEKYAKHPNDAYRTNEEAQLALRDFVGRTKLVPSVIVHSGAGLHVYYALSEDVTEGVWTPMARALGRLAKQHGLRADAACTTDSARILRPVGSTHTSGARVRILRSTGATYTAAALQAKLVVEEPEQFTLTPIRKAKLDVNASVPEWEPTPTSARKAAERCGALREVADAKGNVSEPQWRNMIGLVRYTVEGDELAHEWSCGHPDYDYGETAAKLDGWHGSGPTTCDTFGRHSAACASCPQRGKIKSPIVLGRMTEREIEDVPPEKLPAPTAAPEVAPELPFKDIEFGDAYRPTPVGDRWVLNAKKIVETKDLEGDTVKTERWVTICAEVFWISGWNEAGEEDGEDAAFTVHLYANASRRVRKWSVPSRTVGTRAKLLEWLASLGIVSTSSDPATTTLMHNYVISQFNAAKHAHSRLSLRTRFGVQYLGDGPKSELVVAHGRYIIRGNMTIEEAVLGQKLIARRNALIIRPLPPSPSGVWAREVWKTHIMPGARRQVEFFQKYYGKRGYEVAQLAVMLGLSSPFMVFAADTQFAPGAQLPQVGLTVSLYSSQSGQGKTAIQRSIASAYGDPSQLVLSGSSHDATATFQAGLAAIQGTMPYFLDEVTQNTAADTALLINRIAQGNDRHRGTITGDPKTTKTWALIGIVSTNIPQRELLSVVQTGSDALQMRVMELVCSFPELTDGAHIEFERDRDTMLAPFYGCLGAVIGLAIAHAGPEKVRAAVVGAFDEAAKLISGSTQRERFFQRGMACVLACHDMLSKIGLTIFDRDTLIREYVKAAGTASEYVTMVRRSPDDLLRKMISDMSPHIIVTSFEGSPGRMEVVHNQSQLRAPYVGRRVQSTGKLFLLSDAIRDWAQKNQVSATEMLNRARSDGYLTNLYSADVRSGRFTLTRGTDLATVHGTVYAIDEAKLFGTEHLTVRPTARLTPIQGGAA